MTNYDLNSTEAQTLLELLDDELERLHDVFTAANAADPQDVDTHRTISKKYQALCNIRSIIMSNS